MTKVVNMDYVRARQRQRRETEEFYALLNGWTLEEPDEGVLPSDVLELIAELATLMNFSGEFVGDYVKLHQGEEI